MIIAAVASIFSGWMGRQVFSGAIGALRDLLVPLLRLFGVALLMYLVYLLGVSHGSQKEISKNQVTHLETELETERERGRREKEVVTVERKTVEDLEEKQKKVKENEKILTGTGGDCPVSPDFLRSVREAYEKIR